MLFPGLPPRKPLPERVTVFASGANASSEIRGFARLGIPVGVSVNHLNKAAIAELIAQQQPVMIDSGAFSEVKFSAEGPRIVRPVRHADWQRRLAIYVRLAQALGTKAMLVAPDQVGNQYITLKRLTRYRAELEIIAQCGAVLLLPLQVGQMSHAEFYDAARLAAGVPLTPAMPMRKAVTTGAALLEFLVQVRPAHIHLLGIGIDNRRADQLIRVIQYYCPDISISMDSNRLRAKAGGGRPLTECEAELRSTETECVYGAVDSPILELCGEGLDYTDLIASPALWSDPLQLQDIAVAAGLTDSQASAFLKDPDGFLQSPLDSPYEMSWIEHPLVELALDCAWKQFVYRTVSASIRTAAIVKVFEDSPIRRRGA